MRHTAELFAMEISKCFDLRYVPGPFGEGQWFEYDKRRDWVAVEENNVLLLIRRFLKDRHCIALYDFSRAVLRHLQIELIQSQPGRRRAGTKEKTT
jgi:hypothetical protein